MTIEPATPIDTTLRALADPTRRRILRLVRDDERAVKDIATAFTVSRPAISQHLRVLEDADLVAARKDGTRRLYRARPEQLRAVFDELGQLWDDSLSRLKQVAEAEARSKR